MDLVNWIIAGFGVFACLLLVLEGRETRAQSEALHRLRSGGDLDTPEARYDEEREAGTRT